MVKGTNLKTVQVKGQVEGRRSNKKDTVEVDKLLARREYSNVKVEHRLADDSKLSANHRDYNDPPATQASYATSLFKL